LWSILFGGVILAEVIAVLITPAMGWGLPKNVCSFGPEVDNLFHFILYITGIVFVLTEGLMVYYMYRYTGKEGQKSLYVHGNHNLEFMWTAVTAVILVVIAFTQVGAWERIKYQSRMPKPHQVMEVSARQFEWRIRYPSIKRMELLDKNTERAAGFGKEVESDDIYVVNEVHIWKEADVRIFLKTRDVIHSFFLPNLRVKQDALPGKTIPVTLKALEANCHWNDEDKKLEETPGELWELACAELCGWGHYKMQGKLYVHPSMKDFKKWLRHAEEEQNRRTPDVTGTETKQASR